MSASKGPFGSPDGPFPRHAALPLPLPRALQEAPCGPERFTEVVGLPSMHYLALWRTQLASRLLADGRPVAAVASAVGYGSEAAFSRAFKKLVGQAPGTWRSAAGPAPGRT